MYMEKTGDWKDVLGGVLLAQLLWEECLNASGVKIHLSAKNSPSQVQTKVDLEFLSQSL